VFGRKKRRADPIPSTAAEPTGPGTVSTGDAVSPSEPSRGWEPGPVVEPSRDGQSLSIPLAETHSAPVSRETSGPAEVAPTAVSRETTGPAVVSPTPVSRETSDGGYAGVDGPASPVVAPTGGDRPTHDVAATGATAPGATPVRPAVGGAPIADPTTPAVTEAGPTASAAFEPGPMAPNSSSAGPDAVTHLNGVPVGGAAEPSASSAHLASSLGAGGGTPAPGAGDAPSEGPRPEALFIASSSEPMQSASSVEVPVMPAPHRTASRAPIAAEQDRTPDGATGALEASDAGSPLVASAAAAAAEQVGDSHVAGDVSRGTVPHEAADHEVHGGAARAGADQGAEQASAVAGVPHTGSPASELPDELGEDSPENTHDRNDENPVTDADKAPHLPAGDPTSAATTTADNTAGPRRSSRLDSDEERRAALVESLPVVTDDTPLMAELQQDARRRIELRGRRFPQPQSTRIITVANQKGGVGKTTTTVNLAAALAQSGLNVLVLDNDPQGNASTALGVEHRAGTPSIYEVLVEGAPISEAVQQSPDVENLWCLPATIDLSGAEIELVSMVARETRLRNALDAYLEWRIQNGQAPIDYVFVDCPPSLGLLTVNAFVVGREVLIPIQCEYYALEGLSQLLKTIQLIQAHLNPELHVSTILLTMYDARTNLAQQVAGEVRTHFPERTLRTTVPRSVRISEAPSYGQTVMTYDAGSSGALAYLEAARELAERGADGLGQSTSSDDEPAAGGSATASSTNGLDTHGVTNGQEAHTQADESHRDQVRMNEPAMAATQEEQ